MCTCVNQIFELLIQPVVDIATEDKIEAEEYFNNKETKLKASDAYLRSLGVILLIAGFMCLFYPLAE